MGKLIQENPNFVLALIVALVSLAAFLYRSAIKAGRLYEKVMVGITGAVDRLAKSQESLANAQKESAKAQQDHNVKIAELTGEQRRVLERLEAHDVLFHAQGQDIQSIGRAVARIEGMQSKTHAAVSRS